MRRFIAIIPIISILLLFAFVGAIVFYSLQPVAEDSPSSDHPLCEALGYAWYSDSCRSVELDQEKAQNAEESWGR